MLKYIKNPKLVGLLVAILSITPFLRFMADLPQAEVLAPEAVMAGLAAEVSGSVSISVAKPGAVKAVSEPVLANGCVAGKSSAFTAVQSAGVINLNQPASCFSLSFSAPAPNTYALSVKPLMFDYSAAKVRVVSAPVSMHNLSQGENSGIDFNQAPLIYASFVPLLWFRRLVRQPIKTHNRSFTRKVFSLEELSIMRC